jgi:hypothetical protein
MTKICIPSQLDQPNFLLGLSLGGKEYSIFYQQKYGVWIGKRMTQSRPKPDNHGTVFEPHVEGEPEVVEKNISSVRYHSDTRVVTTPSDISKDRIVLQIREPQLWPASLHLG